MSGGARLVYCEACGAAISERARFCTSCGTPQTVADAAPAAPPPTPPAPPAPPAAVPDPVPADPSPFEGSLPLWKRPERLIRDYAERQGGQVSVPARHLRSSWDLDEWGSEAQQQIESALRSVGVVCDPGLSGTSPDDTIVMTVGEIPVEPEPEPEPEPTPEPEPAEVPEATQVLAPALEDLPPPTAPAGWYANSAGTERERWWDGEGWTDRVR